MNEIREKKLGNLWGFTGGNYVGNVYDKECIAPALLTMQGGGKQPMIVVCEEECDDNDQRI